MRRMNLVLRYAIASVVMLTQISNSSAERDAFRSVTIDQAVEAALRSNDGIMSDSLEIAIQSANLQQARLPDNPEIVLESDNVGFTDGNPRKGMPLSIRLEQSFQPIARKKKSSVATAGVQIAHVNFLKRKQDLIAETKTRFIAALALQKMKTLADSLVEISSKTHGVAVQQATSGKVSYSDTLRTASEFALARVQGDRVYHNLVNAYQELASLWGTAQVDFVCQGNELEFVAIVPDSASILAGLSNAPQNRLSICELAKKRAELALEEALRVPSIRAGAGIGTVAGANEISPQASLSLSIPFLNRNQGTIKAARYGVSQAEHKRDAMKAQIRKDALNTYRDAARMLDEIHLFNGSILPQLQESLAASYAAYVSGKIGILSLMDAQRSFYETTRDFLEISRDFQFSLIELERITATNEFTAKTSQKELP